MILRFAQLSFFIVAIPQIFLSVPFCFSSPVYNGGRGPLGTGSPVFRLFSGVRLIGSASHLGRGRDWFRMRLQRMLLIPKSAGVFANNNRLSGLIHLTIVVGTLGLDKNDFSRGIGRLATAALTEQDISPCCSLRLYLESPLSPTEDTVYLSDLSFSRIRHPTTITGS
jgi:hypothetical protein